MAWYRTGTITVTNGSTTVTGIGTAWIVNAAIGEGLLAPDGKIYEIANIASDTSMTLGSAYLGTTASTQPYVIAPTQSYIRDLAAQAADLVNNYSTIYNTTGAGKFADGTLAAPGITFQTDTDTGFFHSASNEVTFVAGGTAIFKYSLSGGLSLTTGGDLVGTTATQTLTNKTLTAPVISGGTINNAVIGGTTPAAGSFTSLTDSGNLTFTGTGNRITGDFSNATHSNRVLVQTSTANGNTIFGIIPNGTSVVSQINLYNNPDTTNASVLQLQSNSTTTAIGSGQSGTGTYLPLTINTGGSERVRIDTSGNVGIGTSSPSASAKLTLTGTNTAAALLVANSSQGLNTGLFGSVAALIGSGTSNDLAIASFGSANTTFYTSSNERMRIDSAGNVGIGTTSPSKKLDIRASSAGEAALIKISNDDTSGVTVASIEFANGGVAKASIAAAVYGNDFMSFRTNGNTERMRIDSSGNVGIGNTATNRLSLTYDPASGQASVGPNSTGGSTFLTLGTSNAGTYSERMRIDSSGNLLVNTNANPVAAKVNIAQPTAASWAQSFQLANTAYGTIYTNTSGTNSYGAIGFYNNGASYSNCGSIEVGGTSTAYLTSSDYRLKENVQPMQNALETVAKLKPCTYTWKSTGEDGQGFIAHELQAIFPDCVSGEKDGMRTERYEITPAVPATFDEDGNELTPAVEAVIGEREVPAYQGIDTSFLVATLVKAIQELKAEIDALKVAK